MRFKKMPMAMNAWSRTSLKGNRDVRMGHTTGTGGGDHSLLLVDECPRNDRNNPKSKIVPLIDIDRRHERHKTRHTGMDKAVFERTGEGRHEDLALGVGSEKLGESAEKDARVGSDRRLGVGLGLGK